MNGATISTGNFCAETGPGRISASAMACAVRFDLFNEFLKKLREKQQLAEKLQPVKCLGVVVHDLLRGGMRNLAAVRALFQQTREFKLHRLVAMGVVGADHEVVFAGDFDDVG